jgi:hypothetical protein
MSYSVDPERLYCNVSGSSGNTATFSTDNFATITTRRNVPLISDLSKYVVCIVRGEVQGLRTIPCWTAPIDQTQPFPNVTTLQLNATLTTYGASATVQLPTATTSYYMDIQTFDTTGTLSQPWLQVMCTFTAGMTLAAWALAVQAAIRAASTDAACQNMVVSVSTTSPNCLEFVIPGGGPGAGYNFALTVGVHASPNAITVDATAFGFLRLPAGSYPYAYMQQTAGAAGLTLPNAAFGSAMTVTGTYTSPNVPLIWSSPSGLPLPPVGTQNPAAFWMYDFPWFSGMFNTALQTAVSSVVTAAARKGYSGTLQGPYIVYNNDTKNFTLYLDPGASPSLLMPGGVNEGRLLNSQTAQLSISLNPMLADLLMFPSTTNPQTRWETVNSSQAPVVSGPYPAVGTPQLWVAVTPSFPVTGNLWSPAGSLAFQTQLIPVRSEVLSAPLPVGTSTIGYSSAITTDTSSMQIMTDVIPAQSDATDWNAFHITYQPTQKRWADLPTGAVSLQTLDMSLFWRDTRTGVYTPLILNPGASFDVKLMFRRRDVVDT